ncbi:DUF2972 domain-containing protein [Helicobacter saguini]|uniref:DUF2972 domain-containing protein n=1 Tax=Helicobacter saguini TaxID=1548018 RepID=A0A347VS95_9HELI|nr:DUF2972 domain-containing protein [Helicobacter saguini]MWV62599.1 DUF2972 domain-containing protein [Helicobacter saguini]MWV66728.1 DUF2972 domain-containing protein [Helicobacter saguini]MWV69078.1 DUF2972 domain-containing protein [Helicobacter saguini]TLD94002.1 DUF2972 domain-containing protein [Helicobacter saguini]
MNLPIPHNYNYVFFAFGASAHGTIIDFLELILNIKIDKIHTSYFDSKYNSIPSYLPYPNNKKDMYVYDRIFVMHHFYDYKFPYLAREMPFIILVRDPISRLKTMVNHGFLHPNVKSNTFFLHDDLKVVLDRRCYYGLEKNFMGNSWDNLSYFARLPSVDITRYYVDIAKCMNYPYSSIANICKNNVFYMDMSEFLPQNVIESLKKYAKFFNKNIEDSILEKHKAYLQEKKWSNLAYAIPLNMQIPLNNTILTLHINLKNEIPKNMIEISDLLFDKDYEILKIVGFGMNSYDLCMLKNNEIALIDVRFYMQEFLSELIKIDKKILDSQVKESDIIAYFKANKALANDFKSLLDKELEHIKKHRPDIVESWKFYQQFEKLF